MNLDGMIVAMNHLSEGGPDNQFWPVVFVGGCNLRCPYCLNSLIASINPGEGGMPIADVMSKLDEWGEGGVMISGGEPLMPRDPDITDLIKALAIGGRKVGICTNGTWPDKLKDILDSGLVSYVALDCKFGPTRVSEEDDEGMLAFGGHAGLTNDIAKSLMNVFIWHMENQQAMSEVRMTLYPPVIGEADIVSAAKMVHKNSRFVLQQYRSNLMFDGLPNQVSPYPEEEVERFRSLAAKCCQANVEVRWP